MVKHLLKVDSIIKHFGHRQILSDIYLTCETGQICGILGRNGSGKSTLLKIIFGTESVNHKYVNIDGRVFSKAYLGKNQIAYLPQHSFAPPWSSVRRTIATFLDNHEVTQKVNRHRFIQPISNQKVNTLSYGELRFLEFMLLIHSEAKFILLDEPFLGVSPIYQEEIKHLLREYKSHKGIIITDHNYRHILELSDSLILIHQGHCKHIQSAEELRLWGYLSA